MNFVWMWLRKCLMVLKTGHLVKNNDCLPYYSGKDLTLRLYINNVYGIIDTDCYFARGWAIQE